MPRSNHTEDLPIPLDQEMIVRLARLGRAVGRHPRDVAAALLRDLLNDDERVNIDALIPGSRQH